ncbi:MAG TPA: MerR family transcriptional regulator [Brevibacterium sp.]|nr:MerR family transcriptional regulator [Brevibacterium sp.]
MRIGEVAPLLGITTRTVRHYHRTGVVPEPARRDNGYRDYGVRDVILLMRAVRLAGLGLSLDEVADVLRDDDMRELTDILQELDADLARQEREVRARRDALRRLRDRLRSSTGDDGADTADDAFLPDDARTLFATLRMHGAGRQSLDVDRGIMSALPEESVRAWAESMSDVTSDPAASARMAAIYRRFDDLGHGDAATQTDDAEIRRLAHDLLAAVPEPLRRQFLDAPADEIPFLDAVTDDLSAAQAAVIRHLLALRGPQ